MPWLPRSLALGSYNARLRSQNFVYPPVIDLALAVSVQIDGPHRSNPDHPPTVAYGRLCRSG